MTKLCSGRDAVIIVRIIFAIIICAASTAAGATAQIADQLVIDGKSERLISEPLWQALRDHPQLQQNLLKYISKDKCSSSWRGYMATWEVRENELFLVKVEANPCSSNPTLVPLAELFPGATGPVKATWFTGTLTVTQGRQVEYVHMGYESRYERHLVLQVDKGNVINKARFSRDR